MRWTASSPPAPTTTQGSAGSAPNVQPPKSASDSERRCSVDQPLWRFHVVHPVGVGGEKQCDDSQQNVGEKQLRSATPRNQAEWPAGSRPAASRSGGPGARRMCAVCSHLVGQLVGVPFVHRLAGEHKLSLGVERHVAGVVRLFGVQSASTGRRRRRGMSCAKHCEGPIGGSKRSTAAANHSNQPFAARVFGQFATVFMGRKVKGW